MNAISGALYGLVCLTMLANYQNDQLWLEKERLFANVVELRAKELEKVSGFSFQGELPKVEFDAKLKSEVFGTSLAQYFYEDQSIHFAPLVAQNLREKYRFLPVAVSPTMLAKDDGAGWIIDHELGHFFSDQVSRRNRLGPWYTNELCDSLSYEEGLGLRIVAEGIAVYFQYLRSPKKPSVDPRECFPSTRKEKEMYSLRRIFYDGGFWITNDVIEKHGERGILWFIQNRFSANEGMREAAASYKQRALDELE